MGKAMKVVWPRGKNLKPPPKGRAPLQAIPGPAPRKTAEEKRQDQEYRLALSNYPRGRSPMQVLLADPFLRSWLVAMARSPADSRPTVTLADRSRTGRSMPELLAETPAPSREPIEVTEAQYQALQELPVAETPQELAELACTFGTAVMVVTSKTPITAMEILLRQRMQASRLQTVLLPS